MKARELVRLAAREGWSIRRTGGDHLRLEHPEASGPVFTGSTPSDRRALHNTMAMMKRVMRPKAEGGR